MEPGADMLFNGIRNRPLARLLAPIRETALPAQPEPPRGRFSPVGLPGGVVWKWQVG